MTNEVQQVESLRIARGKLAGAIEIFAPIGVQRVNALELIGASLIEFEAAVREDERAKSGDAVALAQAQALDAQAGAHGDRVAAEAALRGAADAQNVTAADLTAPTLTPPSENIAVEEKAADAPPRKRK
jgi:hypothetical protein